MKNDSLIILAGGASSRMKRSLATSNLDIETLNIATETHKSLIPLGKNQKPLLYYLIKNAIAAEITTIYLITSPKNIAFKEFVLRFLKEESDNEINFKYAIQYVPPDRNKPLGTADALKQCIDQYPKILQERFTVCNGDNLYSIEAFNDLKKDRKVPNALISYSSKELGFSEERIAKFALMHIDKDDFLKGIIEKPKPEVIEVYRNIDGSLRVSMNIFNFYGESVYPYLKNCLLNPLRNEKELPQAVRKMIEENAKSVVCYPRSETIPDLTDANDIKRFENYKY